MYVPLNIKTENTLLSSLIKIDDLISFAKKNNIKALTITDNKMYGAYEFYKKCIQNDINPIIGIELYLEDKEIILYAKDYTGYKNLLKLASISPVTEVDLENHKDGLLCIIPFKSIALYEKLHNIYIDLFIGYKNNDEEEQIKIEPKVYMGEIFCLAKEDEAYLRYLDSIRNGVPVDSIKPLTDVYLKPFTEVKKEFPKHLDNNAKINDLCKLKIEYHSDLLPRYPCPDNLSAFQYLKRLCVLGLKRIFGDTVKEIYVDRLKYELDVINKMGFCNYFLIVWDYVNFAKEHDILVGPGRGSAAGSLVSYVLNITTIDPIRYNLLFERFLNPERITMPDIDIDFEYTKRQDVVDYCINKYGAKKVAPIITFGTLGSKQSIRDVGKSLDIPLKTIDRVCNQIDAKMSLQENYNQKEKFRNILLTDEKLIKLFKIASRLEGLKRHTSIHAAGIVMSDVDLDEIIPLDFNHGLYKTAYSMEYLEEQGLLKMDFLALKNLTLINDVLKDANIKFDDIPLNDAKAKTNGIFQFESAGMMSFLKKFKPSNFEEVVATIALYRPGPMGNIDTYIKRKRGLEPVTYIVKELEPILKSTYGIIIYQEQIMQIAQVMAGYSLGEADVLRRAMSKKKEDVLLNERKNFITKSVSKGFSLNDATKVYELILKFASYGFNKAHSVAYAMISYKVAYLKVHYPLIFMCHLLNTNIGSEAKTKEYIFECKTENIQVLAPDINLSCNSYVVKDNKLIYPFSNIKNIGIQAVEKILSARKDEPFTDIFDFITRCDLGKSSLENLIFTGCFNKLGYNKRTLIENLDKILNYRELGDLLDDKELLPVIEQYDEYDNKFLMEKELEILGFYLSNHPVTEFKIKYNSIDLKDIADYFDKRVNVVIYVDKIKMLETKSKEKMCFVTASDEISTADVVFFPRAYTIAFDVHDILYINAKVEKRFDKYQLVVNRINQVIKQ